MQLYFLRHGEADWPDWDQSDDARPLTGRGRKEIEKVADFLKLLDVAIDEIVTSPLPRAKQTAVIVADRLKLKLREDSALKPGFDRAGLKRVLRKYDSSAVMLVGHEPDFTSVIQALTGATLKLSKGGLALVNVDVEKMSGQMLWLLPPKIAKARR
ncbi:MAG TPA: phosphohistidine phosphatase SixA [Chthoniobacterales bacterium]